MIAAVVPHSGNIRSLSGQKVLKGCVICAAGVVIFTIRLPESCFIIKNCTRVLRLTAAVGFIRYFTFNYHFL